jgi:anti-anti-sigma regulatory factor
MLRVEFNHDGNGTLFVQLQGRLVGPYAEDARMTLARYQAPPTIVVDLSEVTFVDSLGEEVLLWLGRMGSEFVTENVYARSVCERLQLHISQKRLAHLSRTKPQASL